MRRKTTAELVGAIVGNVIGLIIVNSVSVWRPWTFGVVQGTWADILWAANLSLTAQIVGNALLIAYRPARFYALMQAIFAAVGLLSIAVFYAVFPLDFSHFIGGWVNTVLRILLIIGMIVTAVTGVVHLVRLVMGTPYRHGVP